MNKKNNLALYTLIFVGLVSLFTITFFAQKSSISKTEQPTNSIGRKDVLQNYLDISSLLLDKRSAFFNALSAEEKADAFKLHLALQFVKRPNLTQNQKEVILDGILMTSSETYNKENSDKIANAQQKAVLLETKAKTVFSGREGFEIFANIGGDTNDIQYLQKYQLATEMKYEVERRTFFKTLSTQEKSNTMRTHLILQMVNRSLNPEQLRFITDFSFILTPDNYGIGKESSEWKRLDDILNSYKERMAGIFPKEEAVAIFASLGGEKAISQNAEELNPNCSCSTASDYCGWWRRDATCGSGSCNGQIGGCGTGLLYDCNGMCFGGLLEQ